MSDNLPEIPSSELNGPQSYPARITFSVANGLVDESALFAPVIEVHVPTGDNENETRTVIVLGEAALWLAREALKAIKRSSPPQLEIPSGD